MMMANLVLSCVLTTRVVALPTMSFGRQMMRFEAMGMEVSEGKKAMRPSKGAEERLAPPKYSYFFTQRLDHFDGSNPTTFQQRYFVNSSFFDGSGPVFLCVGGEGPAMSEDVLYSSAHCNDMTELATQVGGLMFALEHRYYGNSIPAASRKYLSSQQAVADIGSFVQSMTETYRLDIKGKNKWTTWGGSYPGMLAGFARLKLPHLIHAASSSSSPWRAVVDMPEYNDRVGHALSIETVGGSELCRSIVEDGHEQIGRMFASNQSAEVAQKFNFCSNAQLATSAAQKNFAGYGVISFDAQDNDPASTKPASNVETICAALLAAKGDNVDKLAAVSKIQSNNRCLGLVTTDLYAALQDDDDDIVRTDSLSWPYQTCSQFGFYQTCEIGSRCPWTKGYVTLEDEASFCPTAFNIPMEQISENVAFSNAYYGSDTPEVTRIFFANGDVDPWGGLGVIDAPKGSKVLQVNGSAHHTWTHDKKDIVQDSVHEAKLLIQQQMLLWLQED